MMDRLYRHSITHPGRGEWTVIVASGVAVRRGLLRAALDTVGRLGERSRTLCVVGRADCDAARAQMRDGCDHVLLQPSSIELCAALFVALALVREWAPDARVTAIVLAADNDEPDPIIVCDHIATLWRTGCACAPALIEALDAFAPSIDTDDEDACIEAVFSLAPYVDVREVFPRPQPRAAVPLAVSASALG